VTDQGLIIAKRSVSLTKTYPIIGIVISLSGLLVSSVSGLANTAQSEGVQITSGSLSSGVIFLAVPLQALASLLFATPVLLLFVYDKNNGVLEYLLSLGLNQTDIYRRYLKAALILAGAVVAFDTIVNAVAGVAESNVLQMLEISGVVVVLGLAAVSFGTLIMMSFSSLQRQRVGSNQPLGMTIGVFTVLPSYIAPFAIPAHAFEVDLSLAAVVVGLAAVIYVVAGKAISREKLLP
jgi:hypothetical protein